MYENMYPQPSKWLRGYIGISISRAAYISYGRVTRYLNLLDMKEVSQDMCMRIFQKHGSVHESQHCASTVYENGAITWVYLFIFSHYICL